MRSLPELTRICFFIGLFDNKVDKLFFHMPRFLVFLQDMNIIETAQGRQLFRFFGIVRLVFIPNEGALKRVN